MCECRDPVVFVQAHQNWLLEAIRLNLADMRALAGDFAILTGGTVAEQWVVGPEDGALKTRRERSDPSVSQPAERVAAE